MAETWCKDHEIKGKKGVLLFIAAQPGASKSQLKGLHGERLKIAVNAPPVDGAANDALIEFLSELLHLAKSKIHFKSGETSRQKNFWIEGLSTSDLLMRIQWDTK